MNLDLHYLLYIINNLHLLRGVELNFNVCKFEMKQLWQLVCLESTPSELFQELIQDRRFNWEEARSLTLYRCRSRRQIARKHKLELRGFKEWDAATKQRFLLQMLQMLLQTETILADVMPFNRAEMCDRNLKKNRMWCWMKELRSAGTNKFCFFYQVKSLDKTLKKCFWCFFSA